MKPFMLTITLLLFFVSCQNAQEKQTEHDAMIAKQARQQLMAELKAKEEAKQKALKAEEDNTTLSKIGITTSDGKITIDTNKTKAFFQDITKDISKKIKKVTDDLQEGMIKDKNAGIEIGENHINIDLNKTKSFLDSWGKKMQSVVQEFDEMAKEINETTKQSQ